MWKTQKSVTQNWKVIAQKSDSECEIVSELLEQIYFPFQVHRLMMTKKKSVSK